MANVSRREWVELNFSRWEINKKARQDRELIFDFLERWQASFWNPRGARQNNSFLARLRSSQGDRHSRARQGARAKVRLKSRRSFQPHSGWQEHYLFNGERQSRLVAPGRLPAARPTIALGPELVKVADGTISSPAAFWRPHK